MPVLTVYGPVPTGTYTRAERRQFRLGDFRAASWTTLEALEGAVAHAQQITHGKNSALQFANLHISGASLGASNALGAVAKFQEDDLFNIKSVTTQELVMGPKNLPDLLKRFTIGGIVGETSTQPFNEQSRSIGEAALRQAIDHKGSEVIGMNLRMLQGASKLSYMMGLTRPEYAVEAVDKLQGAGINVMVATADNSAMSDKTRVFISRNAQQVHIGAQEGARIGHLADEHVALSALVIALNVTKTQA